MVHETCEKKWYRSFYIAIAVFLIMNPYTFKFVNSLTSKMKFDILSSNGCPTYQGVLLHSIVLLLVIRALMEVRTF
jgi:hypothetical protein